MPRARLLCKEDVMSIIEELGAYGVIPYLAKLKTAPVSSADVGIAPNKKTQRSLYHVLYADRHGETVAREWTEWVCPVCNWFVGSHRVTRAVDKKKPCNFCTQCGQKIDWSGIDLGDDYEAPTVMAP